MTLIMQSDDRKLIDEGHANYLSTFKARKRNLHENSEFKDILTQQGKSPMAQYLRRGRPKSK